MLTDKRLKDMHEKKVHTCAFGCCDKQHSIVEGSTTCAFGCCKVVD